MHCVAKDAAGRGHLSREADFCSIATLLLRGFPKRKRKFWLAAIQQLRSRRSLVEGSAPYRRRSRQPVRGIVAPAPWRLRASADWHQARRWCAALLSRLGYSVPASTAATLAPEAARNAPRGAFYSGPTKGPFGYRYRKRKRMQSRCICGHVIGIAAGMVRLERTSSPPT
jgi:hypothetical protein